MSTYGRQVLSTTNTPIAVTADGAPEWKSGGLTIDWSTVAAVSGSDVTYADGLVVKVGYKGLRYGQILTKITATGMFGPYDTAAADGRQTVARGNVVILNESILQSGAVPALGTGPTDHPGGIEGGRVFKDRILATTGTHSLAAGPTFAELEAAMPRLSYAQN